MDREKLKEIVGNRFFVVEFIKKNGEVRKILGRLGVKSYLKGGEKSYDDKDFNYLTVFDMQKKAYRTVNCNTILSLKFRGEKIVF